MSDLVVQGETAKLRSFLQRAARVGFISACAPVWLPGAVHGKGWKHQNRSSFAARPLCVRDRSIDCPIPRMWDMAALPHVPRTLFVLHELSEPCAGSRVNAWERRQRNQYELTDIDWRYFPQTFSNGTRQARNGTAECIFSVPFPVPRTLQVDAAFINPPMASAVAALLGHLWEWLYISLCVRHHFVMRSGGLPLTRLRLDVTVSLTALRTS